MRAGALKGWLYPASLLGFTGVTVRYTALIFTTTTRWGAVAALATYLLATGRLFAALRNLTGMLALTYATWCVFTTIWSEVPELTGAKSAAQLLVMLAFMGGGIAWVDWHGVRGALSSLFPVLILTLFAGFGAGVVLDETASVARYQGLTGNSNMLGSLAAMSAPLILWMSYQHRSRSLRRWLWRSLTLAVAAILALAVSRSAIGAVLLTCVGLLLGRGFRRGILIALLVAGIAGTMALVIPEFIRSAQTTYVLKGSDEGVFVTRAEVWAESYEQALKGGVLGGGFGVTIGDTQFQGGFTAIGYGREQGNSQLAIWEQTGLVGLALYGLLVIALLGSSWRTLLAMRDPSDRVVAGITFGTLAGYLFMSVFEAWWVSPGSPEAAFFWGMVGISEGLRRQVAIGHREAGLQPQLDRATAAIRA